MPIYNFYIELARPQWDWFEVLTTNEGDEPLARQRWCSYDGYKWVEKPDVVMVQFLVY